MTLLLTGFEPFGGHKTNPSEALARHFDKTWSGDEELITHVLPVDYDRSSALLLELIQRHAPRAVLMTGLAENTTLPRLERVALNIQSAAIADNMGVMRQGELIIPEAPLALKTGLDVYALQQKLSENGLPTEVSHHAGTYLCNHIFFSALWAAKSHAILNDAIFLHLPPGDAAQNSTYFAHMARLVERTLTSL